MIRLSRKQMKNVVGGVALEGNACISCTTICHSTSYEGGSYGYGNCNTQGAAGHPAICDNYCCQSGQATYWCNQAQA